MTAKFDYQAFIAAARDPRATPKPTLTPAEFIEISIENFRRRPVADRKIALAELGASIWPDAPAGVTKAFMDDEEILFRHLRSDPGLIDPFCVDSCGRKGPVRMARCCRCGWFKVLCVGCASRKDVLGIDMDDKLLLSHGMFSDHDPGPVPCPACGRKNRLRNGVAGAKCGACRASLDDSGVN